MTTRKIRRKSGIDLHFKKSLQCLAWEKTARFLYLLLYLICYKIFLVEVFEENLDSQTYITGKGKNILIAFSNAVGYPSLMPHPNSTGGSLRISFTVEGEAMSANFTCSVLLPYRLVYLVFWTQRLPTCDSVISHIDHLENTGSLNYADLPNVNILHTISENCIS